MKIFIISILIFSLIIISVNASTVYDFIIGRPVQTNEDNFTFLVGRPYIIMNGTIGEAPVGDTCDCSSIQAANAIDCSENCDISVCDFGGENFTTINTGSLTVSGDLTNIDELLIGTTGCNITLDTGINMIWQ